MNLYDYVQTPQNDLEQLKQIVSEYSTEPSKGLAHGIQKDAIQNGTGARSNENENTGYINWKFIFELIKINDKYALSFWDEGTSGLIGEILNNEEIQQWSAESKLTSEQKLGRFLSRFDSGGEKIGAGCFGRGKLIFQAGSENFKILCDSLRETDGKYIAFDRLVDERNLLVQRRKPFEGEEAKKYVNEKTEGVLKPLTKPGTRITIFNLRKEISDVFIESFEDDIKEDNWDVFSKMISETWWEIIHKYDAKIYLKLNGKSIRIRLFEPLKSIVESKDRVNDWRVHQRKNLPVIIRREKYKIKELKFVLSPENLYEDFHDFWIQRRRMKIGSVKKNITPHHNIQKKIAAYVVLDKKLEEIIIDSEGLTHYGFNLGGSGIRQIREVLRSELVKFEQKLGLQRTNVHKSVHIDMVDAMSEINKIAKELGLLTEMGEGKTIRDIEILIKSFGLPNKGSKRVEDNQNIGPIELEISNNCNEDKNIKLFVFAYQKLFDRKAEIYQHPIDIKTDEEKEIEIPEFQFTDKNLEYAQGVMLYFKAVCRNTGDLLGQVTRMLWYGADEPEEDNKFSIIAYKPIFPRDRSRRVELTEHIQNISFKITNNTAEDVRINADLVIRKAKTESSAPIPLSELIKEKDLTIESMQDQHFNSDSVEISNELFGAISEGPASAEERKCEIYFSARIADNFPSAGLIKGEKIGKRTIPFYVNIDPPGSSIFKKTEDTEDPNNPKRSYHLGGAATGYTFVLNLSHPSFIIASENGIKKEYIIEEMLKHAYAIAIENKVFKGASKDYEESLATGEISPSESFITIDEIIGKALLALR